MRGAQSLGSTLRSGRCRAGAISHGPLNKEQPHVGQRAGLSPERAGSLRSVVEGDLRSKLVEGGLLLHMKPFDVLKRGLQV